MPITSASNYTTNGKNLGSITIDVSGGVGGGGSIPIEVTLVVQNSYFQCIGGNPANYVPFGDNDVVWSVANYTGSKRFIYDWQRSVPSASTDYAVYVRAPNDDFHVHWGFIEPYSMLQLAEASEFRRPLEIDPRLLEEMLKKLLPKPFPEPPDPKESNRKRP